MVNVFVSAQIEKVTNFWRPQLPSQDACFLFLCQHLLLPATCFPDDWHHRPGDRWQLDLHPLLLHVHCGPHWKLPDPLGCEEDPQPAQAHVLLPVHAGPHRHGPHLGHNAHHTVLWFDHQLIGFNACLIQLLFLHSFSMVESSVLLAMSFDRFEAISNPLRYASVLTNNVIIRIGLAIMAHTTVSLFPGPFLLKRLTFCPGKILLSHSFCFHADVMKWACADITVNIIYGLYVVLSTVGFDSLLIVLSCALILHTVMRLASPRERIRALNTCVSHILAVLVFFIPVIGVSMIHRFGRHLSPIVHALFCLRVPGGAPCAQPRHLQCQVQAHQGGHAQDAEQEEQRLMETRNSLRIWRKTQSNSYNLCPESPFFWSLTQEHYQGNNKQITLIHMGETQSWFFFKSLWLHI